jgi:ribosomal protein L15
MSDGVKQISVSTRIVTTEINKSKVKELIQELQNLKAIDESDAEVIIAAADCL